MDRKSWYARFLHQFHQSSFVCIFLFHRNMWKQNLGYHQVCRKVYFHWIFLNCCFNAFFILIHIAYFIVTLDRRIVNTSPIKSPEFSSCATKKHKQRLVSMVLQWWDVESFCRDDGKVNRKFLVFQRSRW